MHVNSVQPFVCVTLFLLDEGLRSISSVVQGQLVKMLITLETHGIFGSNFAYLCSNIVQPLVCKTVTMLRQISFRPVKVF